MSDHAEKIAERAANLIAASYLGSVVAVEAPEQKRGLIEAFRDAFRAMCWKCEGGGRIGMAVAGLPTEWHNCPVCSDGAALPAGPPAQEEAPPTRCCPSCQGTGDGQVEGFNACHSCGGSGDAPGALPEPPEPHPGNCGCPFCDPGAAERGEYEVRFDEWGWRLYRHGTALDLDGGNRSKPNLEMIASALNRKEGEPDGGRPLSYAGLLGELLELFGLSCGDMPTAGNELLRRVRELAACQQEGEHPTAAHVVTKEREGGGRDEAPHSYLCGPRRETREEAMADLARWEGQQEETELLRREIARLVAELSEANVALMVHGDQQEGEHPEPGAKPFAYAVNLEPDPDWKLIFSSERPTMGGAWRMIPCYASPAPRQEASGQEAEAEPAAWLELDSHGEPCDLSFHYCGAHNPHRHTFEPLYLHPARQEASGDGRLREAAEGVLASTGIDVKRPLRDDIADTASVAVSAGSLRRLRAALDAAPPSTPGGKLFEDCNACGGGECPLCQLAAAPPGEGPVVLVQHAGTDHEVIYGPFESAARAWRYRFGREATAEEIARHEEARWSVRPAPPLTRVTPLWIEEYDAEGEVHWIVSLSGQPNPKAEDAIECATKDDAKRLVERWPAEPYPSAAPPPAMSEEPVEVDTSDAFGVAPALPVEPLSEEDVRETLRCLSVATDNAWTALDSHGEKAAAYDLSSTLGRHVRALAAAFGRKSEAVP